jgi:hypothetical protein
MTTPRLAAFFLLVCSASLPLRAAPDDGQVAARNAASDLAGAFSNDGFKMRDGAWTGEMVPHKSQLIQVNLYAGNQYWFSLGATPQAKKLTVTVFDEAGKALPSEPYADNARAAAGFAPEVSGPYYIRIEETEGAPASFCLLYSYK